MPNRNARSRALSPLAEFVASQSGAAVILFVAATLAILLANSIYASDYFHFWELHLPWDSEDGLLQKPLHFWVNDGLMAVFFLLVGLEIKRELAIGELSNLRVAMLPVLAAIGGMVVPAGIYLSMNPNWPERSGWGIPMATDIAFSLGVLSLMGKSIPTALKVFLTAFAIIDDIGAVIVIAFFYTSKLNVLPLLGSTMAVLALAAFSIGKIRSIWPYLLVGALLWYGFYRSGIHTTIAGVVTALFIPTLTGQHGTESESKSPAVQLEHWLEKPIALWVIPLFGFANAGVELGSGDGIDQRVSLGVLVGLVLGKPAGIFLLSWLGCRMKLVALPDGVTWRQLLGVGILGGIGFTMSLFITDLAFAEASFRNAAKIGILVATGVAAVVGALVLLPRSASSKPKVRASRP